MTVSASWVGWAAVALICAVIAVQALTSLEILLRWLASGCAAVTRTIYQLNDRLVAAWRRRRSGT